MRRRLEYFNINKGVISNKDKNYFRLTYGVTGALNLYKFMYNSSCIKNRLFLNRKKVVFEKFIKMRP